MSICKVPEKLGDLNCLNCVHIYGCYINKEHSEKAKKILMCREFGYRTGLETMFYLLVKEIKYITRIDNNDHPQMQINEIETLIHKFENDIKDVFNKDLKNLFYED